MNDKKYEVGKLFCDDLCGIAIFVGLISPPTPPRRLTSAENQIEIIYSFYNHKTK